jgi:peroxiredoxin
MNKDSRILLIGIVIALVLALIGLSIHNSNAINRKKLEASLKYIKMLNDPTIAADGKSLIGTQFTDIELNDISGNPFRLSRVSARLKLIILFDTADCSTCLGEYPLWNKLAQTYASSDLFMVAVCAARDKTSVDNFIRDHKIRFPVLWDPEKSARQAMKFCQSPLRILLDKDDQILNVDETLSSREHQIQVMSMIEGKIRSEISK